MAGGRSTCSLLLGPTEPEPCCYFRTDAALPTPAYGCRIFFDWNKVLPSAVKEEPPEGTLAGNRWVAGPSPSRMEVVGGTWVLQVKPRATGVLSRCSPRAGPGHWAWAFLQSEGKEAKGSTPLRWGRKNLAGCGAGSVDRRGSPDSPLATGAGQQGFELSSSTWVIALGFGPEGSNQSL